MAGTFKIDLWHVRRSSQLASGVLHQFKQAVATGSHRLSDTSGPGPDVHGSLGSNQSLEPGSPAHSTSSAPELGQEGDGEADNHIVLNMEGVDAIRYIRGHCQHRC